MTRTVRRPLVAALATAGLLAGLAAPASAATFETVTSLRKAHADACQSTSDGQTSVHYRHDPRDVKRGVSRVVATITFPNGGAGGTTQWLKAGSRPTVHRYTFPEGETFTRLRLTVEFKNGKSRSNRISRAALAHC